MYRTKEGDVFSLIDFINSQNAEVFLFTNQTLITPKTAGILFNKNVTVIGKQNTLDPEKQAKFFCKTPNAQERLSEGLENLINAGFNKVHPSRLALHSVILSANYDELPKMWRQWRRQNIIPYVQVTVPPPDPQSQRAFFENDYVAPDKLRKLFESFLKIDETEFGYTWDVVKTYPIPVMGCSVALSGCGITPTGDVQICSYTESSLGNVKRESLIDIMKSEEVRKIRRYKYEEMNSGNLYGCRCIAFALKDRYSIDPIFKEFEHSTH
ncbi:MAG: SPASM domain-containing protein, partial [Nanoarchaeota archaeon]|nr:SPASM domain-containing protein [Nanoarchaeota archaeon]